jgi:L-ascorbate metabolism protein UlaG (beta-lactamase superfamily)
MNITPTGEPAMTDLHVTRIGHSCHLVEIAGQRLLTDPWFTVTPTYDPGEPVSLSVEQLPDLDGVIITHEHYDHCDLDALARYREPGVPVVVPPTVAVQARDHGFTDVRVLEPWQHTQIGGVTITAAPGKHGVPEITYVLQGEARTVYFGGDTLAIPELGELPERFGHFDLALLPTNGLCIRPMNGQQVVMNATEAAELTAVLRPDVAIPHHYAFTSGWLGDRLITRSDPDPRHFAEAARRLAPATTVLLNLPGARVSIP